jgi:hypothetical protein
MTGVEQSFGAFDRGQPLSEQDAAYKLLIELLT